MRKIFLFAFIFLSLFSIYLITNPTKPNQSSIAGLKTSASQTTVSAFVGEHRFTLYGYTSPGALVSFEGLGIFDQAYANSKGYFELKNRFSPFSPHEACLTAQDVLGRLSTPLCLPPFPTIYNVEIGPVIMPPTVSADVGEYFVGDEAMLSGQTIPNNEVNLSFFIDQRKSFDLIKNAYAFSFPQLKTRSDEKGNFSISIPTSNPTTLRLFARASFENSLSPKSLMLNIKILPWWMIILKIFWLVFDAIKNHWLEVGLLTEFVVLASILINYFFHPHRLTRTKAIMLREKFALIKRQPYLLR